MHPSRPYLSDRPYLSRIWRDFDVLSPDLPHLPGFDVDWLIDQIEGREGGTLKRPG